MAHDYIDQQIRGRRPALTCWRVFADQLLGSLNCTRCGLSQEECLHWFGCGKREAGNVSRGQESRHNLLEVAPAGIHHRAFRSVCRFTRLEWQRLVLDPEAWIALIVVSGDGLL